MRLDEMHCQVWAVLNAGKVAGKADDCGGCCGVFELDIVDSTVRSRESKGVVAVEMQAKDEG